MDTLYDNLRLGGVVRSSDGVQVQTTPDLMQFTLRASTCPMIVNLVR